MIVLKKVQKPDKNKLWNIFQKYLYEMTNYYEMDMNESGNYTYKYFDDYFKDSGRIVLFIYNDEILIGFIMINNYSCLGNSIDYAVGEFTIFPQYRKNYFGMETIQKIFEQYPGRWEIKYSNENKAAERLWKKVTAKYKPAISSYASVDSVLLFMID